LRLVLGRRPEHPRGGDVDREAERRDREHGARGERLGRAQAADGLPDDERGDDEQRAAVEERGEDLPAQVAVRLLRASTAGG
jgi:hypothetical protein